MASPQTESFNSLVAHYLGAPLPGTLADKVSLANLAPDARDVITRMLALMKRSGCPATEINSQMMELLFTVTPGMLPSAWGGRIPPVTFAGRHRKLDAYIAGQKGSSSAGRPVLIDWGCGFPPVTTTDIAAYLPQWTIFGVDRSFARYMLYDPQGHYACFDRNGDFEYFQLQMKPLHDNPEDTRTHFKTLFGKLFSYLTSTDDNSVETVEKNGSRLVSNPVRNFERDNLKFLEGDIEKIRFPSAQVIRCMNVLLYYEKEIRDRMLQSLGNRVETDGILISGMNHPFGIYTRYAVYRKKGGGLVPEEFAFSPDNLRPLGIAPWLTLQERDEEAELLADLVGVLRADRLFWGDFDRRVDALQEAHGIGHRGDDGFLLFSAELQNAPPFALFEKEAALWKTLEAEGYPQGAVEALGRAGYTAWKNPVGDIAVRPPDGSLPVKPNAE
jgi:hypothetical protein